MYKLVKSGGGVGQDVYDAAATYGRIKTSISTIISGFVLILFLMYGIWLVLSKDIYSAKTTAIIKNPDCITTEEKDNKGNIRRTTTCRVNITYTVNNQIYNKNIDIQGPVTDGESLQIRYNPANPIDTTTNISQKMTGLIIIVICLVVGLIMWGWWYLTQKSKLAASAVAVDDAADVVKNIFK